MENFVLNTILDYAKENGFLYIKGEYIPTAKNAMVKDLYPDFGFKKNDPYFILKVKNAKIKTSHIKIKK
jgi:predicted enzyme involved in methoxymalonyl-ACP biosynthesis